MANEELLENLREIFQPEEVETASRTRTGARGIRRRPEPEPAGPDYLALGAVALGAVLIAIAVWRPASPARVMMAPQPENWAWQDEQQEGYEPNYEMR